VKYDARLEIYEHITEVRRSLLRFVADLLARAHEHDASKFQSPEVEEYLEYEPVIEVLPYGSEEQQAARARNIVESRSTQHHYEVCRHHPQHFENGILGMNLMDLAEMLCDWKAASEFTGYGPYKNTIEPFGLEASIEANAERFGYGDELKRILLNTAKVME